MPWPKPVLPAGAGWEYSSKRHGSDAGTIARMFDLTIRANGERTEIAVKVNAIGELGAMLVRRLADPGCKTAVVITDTRVGSLYGPTAHRSLKQAGFLTNDLQVEPGEASKSLEVLGGVYHRLAEGSVGRDAVIIALGGGVVSDLAGFAAATWMRGIPFAVCPTTLEADVDASIGGKTGINLPGGKNLIGAFHHPVLVAIDPACLQTLDARDVRAGLAESVKHALIDSESLFAWHEARVADILDLKPEVTTELILHNLRIKAGIVEQDPYEQTGRRMLLNLGHTIGHAIEACCGYALRHGECVALGMVAACRLSQDLGLLDSSTVTRVERLLHRFGLPLKLPQPIATADIMRAIDKDKKVRGGKPRFVLLEGIGRPVIRSDIPQAQVQSAYESLLP